MPRSPRSILAAVAVVAALGTAPAHADTRGCSGPLDGPAFCTFELQPGDTRVVLHIEVPYGGPPVFAHVICCALLDPVTGEPLRDPRSGGPVYWPTSEGICGSSWGVCEVPISPPPDGVPYDHTVTCEARGEHPDDPIQGTWSCLPR
ncbi:MAG TPA: hypothetical protein VFQ85_13585 [Mycobacteriales bacterium]|jgi:hypothetical protein|nr:hypothetical protein [Mycobacteriales bacterium]